MATDRVESKWIVVTSAATALATAGQNHVTAYLQKANQGATTACFLGGSDVMVTTNGWALTSRYMHGPLRIPIWPRMTLYGITAGTTSVTVAVLRINASTAG